MNNIIKTKETIGKANNNELLNESILSEMNSSILSGLNESIINKDNLNINSVQSLFIIILNNKFIK